MSSGTADRGDNPIIGGQYGGAAQTSGLGSEYGQRAEQEKAEQARDEAGKKFEEAKSRAEQGKEQAASGIGKAADEVRSRTQEQGGAAGQVGEKVADQLDRTSKYLHEHDTDEMLHDFQEYVRRHPIQAVAGATITGFFLARILP